MNLNDILTGYIECALWSTTDSTSEQDDALDENYGVDDLATGTLAKMREDVTDFVGANHIHLVRSKLTNAQIGHDFWLTRNGHGAGFWDRGLGPVGDRLTHA